MRELSLYVLDIAQNSIVAGASLIEIEVTLNHAADLLRIVIRDNGKGMTPEQVESVRDPFFTTRTTRKVGMGIPLFKMAAEMTGGTLDISSTVGIGTVVTTDFHVSHVDCTPLGDMCSTVCALIRMNPQLDFIYRYTVDSRSFTVDTRELKEILEGVPLDTPDVMLWIQGFITEQTENILEVSDL